MRNVPDRPDPVKPADRFTLLSELGFDIGATQSTTCGCGTASVYLVNRVQRGLADVLLRCRLCGTDVAVAATPRDQGDQPEG
jgi:hypothetical protein